MAVTASSSDMDYFSLRPRAGSCSGMVAGTPSPGSPAAPASPASPMAMAVMRMMLPIANKNKPSSPGVLVTSSTVSSSSKQAPISLPQTSSSRSHYSQPTSPLVSHPSQAGGGGNGGHHHHHPPPSQKPLAQLRLPVRNRPLCPSTATAADKPGLKVVGSLARRRGLAHNLGPCPMPPPDATLSSQVNQSFFCNLRQSLDARVPAKQMADNAVLEPSQLPYGVSYPSDAVVPSRVGIAPATAVTSTAAPTVIPPQSSTGPNSDPIWAVLPPWLVQIYGGETGLSDLKYRFSRIERREVHRLRHSLNYYACPKTRDQSKPIQTAPPQPGHESSGLTGHPLHNVGLMAKPQVELAGFELGTKNRYNNIWAYEHSRVKLPLDKSTLPSVEGCSDKRALDYIHASEVSFCCSKRKYIATQGPTPACLSDFWKMVWSRDVRVLVMLTAEVESGSRKSEPYWMAKKYGNFEIVSAMETTVPLVQSTIDSLVRVGQSGLVFGTPATSVTASSVPATPTAQTGYFDSRHQTPTPSTQPREDDKSGIAHCGKTTAATTPNNVSTIVRKLVLRCGVENRTVFQIHYSGWPDFGSLTCASTLLSLVRLCRLLESFIAPDGLPTPATSPINPANLTHYSSSRPVLVHCAAGCGRTGSFTTVDTVLDILLAGKVTTIGMDGPLKAGTGVMAGWKVPYDRKQEDLGDLDPVDQAKIVWTSDLVEAVAEHFRTQRMGMIQTYPQYQLCYETVLKALVRAIV